MNFMRIQTANWLPEKYVWKVAGEAAPKGGLGLGGSKLSCFGLKTNHGASVLKGMIGGELLHGE